MGQFEKKLEITGRENGATGPEFCTYILDVLHGPDLEKKWKSYQ